MKKILVLVLVLLFVFSIAGCGVKEKIEQKVGEKIAEKVIESASGDKDTKVDIDGGKITIKNEKVERLILEAPTGQKPISPNLRVALSLV